MSATLETAVCGGCAAKFPAQRLQELLRALPLPVDPSLLVGLGPSDDAAVYRLDDVQALVFTLDFFPPLVADPADYGAIAAANALSDVFAMGARPLLALSIAVIPEDGDEEWILAVFGASAEQVKQAGAVLAGGHTLRDPDPLYGLAVVGVCAPDEVWTKAGARPGDVLYLSKPLGTGLVVHAARTGEAPGALAAAVTSMRTLNADAAAALRPLAPHAVTDITGFGLLGHAWEIAERSGVRLELDASQLPALPGARELAAAGIRSGGHGRNLEYVAAHLDCTADEPALALACDPQTSGGLLVSLPATATAPAPFLPVGRVVAGEGVALHPSLPSREESA